jgi:hypothetical protein
MLISLQEYAIKHGKARVTIQKMIERGRFETARKIGHSWAIDDAEEYPVNANFKHGRMVGWRKKHALPQDQES